MVVIDASVAYKWFNKDEINYSEAIAVLKNHLADKTKIVVPDLILYELTNVWSTKGTLSPVHIQDNIKLLKQYHLALHRIDFELLKTIIIYSKKFDITSYDATYVVIAQKRKCDLITADHKLLSRVKFPFIKNLTS